jgi:hypothetical protein
MTMMVKSAVASVESRISHGMVSNIDCVFFAAWLRWSLNTWQHPCGAECIEDLRTGLDI